MGSGHRRLLLSALLPLLLPEAWGDCGPLPALNHAEPPEDTKHQESFSEGSRVTYSCVQGYVKLPLHSGTTQCLANSQWSNLPEFCGRSCPSPLHVPFARISQEDEVQNFYPVGTSVTYVCRRGYENTTAQLPTSTCLDNLTWSEVPQLCERQSCGVPANPQHGKVLAKDHLFSAKAEVVCNPGYTLKGLSPFVWCSLRGDGVAWSELPTCWAISCPPPPFVANGSHNGSSLKEFTYNVVVMYTCEPGFQLVGRGTLRCAMENSLDGSWSGSAPECRVSTTAATDQTKPPEEKIAENPSWLASVLIPCCTVPPIAFGLVAGIILRKKGNKTHSYNMHLHQEKNGMDPPMHPRGVDAEKQSHFSPTTTCHVWSTHQQELHTSLAPRAQPGDQGCATCEQWLSAQPGSPCIYSVLSIGDSENWSPTGTSIPAKAADVMRDEDTGEAVPEHEAEQPMDHGSHHTCPICESWLRAHLAQPGSYPLVPREQPGQPQQQDQGPQGPICSLCTDQLHLSHVHSSTASSPVCPLVREGTLGHLVTRFTPSCHLCPICKVATHTHLCEAPEGKLKQQEGVGEQRELPH